MTTQTTVSDRQALPAWSSVLAVVAHPDDESFGLGAVLDGFVRRGTRSSVLCFTQGEASTLHGVSGDLLELGEVELRSAAATLGLEPAVPGTRPDRALGSVPRGELRDEVVREARRTGAEALLVFDPSGVTGHPDHVAATEAALAAADLLGLPVLGWALSAEPGGDAEHLRWLRPAGPGTPEDEPLRMRVGWSGDDRFDIAIRDHVVRVDQPVDLGGEDSGPTPTELFIASLASCVAFYARRYLRRHHLPAEGLAVDAAYRMATKPARVDAVSMVVRLPYELPPKRRDGLLAMARHCTVHNTVVAQPDIDVELVDAAQG